MELTSNESLIAVIIQNLGLLPFYLVWVVGIIFAVIQRAEHPSRSNLLIAGFALFIVASIAQASFNSLLPVMMMQQDLNASQIGSTLAAAGLLFVAINCCAWVLILIAIFKKPRSDY